MKDRLQRQLAPNLGPKDSLLLLNYKNSYSINQ